MSSELQVSESPSLVEDFSDEIEPNSRAHNIATLAIIVTPFIGVLIAIVLLWQEGVTTLDLGIWFGFYVFTGLGVTAGFHRLLTHRSFQTYAPVRWLFTVAGAMSIEGKPTSWVADHRRHHAHSDQPGDPHSPHVGFDDGTFRGMVKGLWHAHWGWLVSVGGAKAERFTPDLLKDSVVMSVDKRFFKLYMPLSLGLPAVIGLVVTGTLQGMLTAFVWGGLVRIFFTHHITWSVNSACHMFGTREWRTTDKSTNNWLLALPTFGEAWHHNHHAFPTSAFHGLRTHQRILDPSGWLIWWMEKLGFAWNVKRVSDANMQDKKLVHSTG